MAWNETSRYIWQTRYAAKGEDTPHETNMRVARTIFGGNADCEREDANLLYKFMNQQVVGFNSPVYFNLGVRQNPQCSACFINSIDDSLESISELANTEIKIFSQGSGSGVNYSYLRAKGAALSNGGTASGPVSFMRALDSMAGVIRSGGKLRRAARMAVLNANHPDVEEFVDSKVRQERMLRKLVEYGQVSDVLNEFHVAFQSTNHSVAFSERPEGKLLRKIAEAAWECGDPGALFLDNINMARFVVGQEFIMCCNPCAEFLFSDNSACNLAVINLAALVELSDFSDSDFERLVSFMIRAMDRIVDLSSYPTEAIERNSKHWRPLGLGYTGIAECLARLGIVYGSEAALDYVAKACSDLTRYAMRASHQLSESFGGKEFAVSSWWSPKDGETPVNNAQVTLLPPGGTISLYLGCESTGIEPLYARKTLKKTVDGLTLEQELSCLAPGVEHKFAADEPKVTWREHLEMAAAAQRCLTGGISKTVNVPENTTVDEIEEIYKTAHELGLKAISVYRDGSKAAQILTSAAASKKVVQVPAAIGGRERLPKTRESVTHKFSVGGQEGYITVGKYADGRPGEVFLSVSKAGSTLQGLLHGFATTLSIALQHGAPISTFIEKFRGTHFPPAGWTAEDTEIKTASSILDYLGQWLDLHFGDGAVAEQKDVSEKPVLTGMVCSECGSQMQRSGTCYLCPSCGQTTGCS